MTDDKPAEIENNEQPTIIDAIADDADMPVWPDNPPDLRSYLRLPFRKRAQFFRKFHELKDQQEQMQALEKKRKRQKTPNADTQLDQMTTLYEMFGNMDDLMRIAALDTDAYEQWVETHSDDDFQQLFAAFMATSQPGEASGSAS